VSYLADPNVRATWKNHAAPYLDPRYQKELTVLGGLNPYGQPNLRFVWGQSEKRFYRGKWRTRYTDDRIPPVQTITDCRVRTVDGQKEVKVYRNVDEALDDTDFGGVYWQRHEYEWIGKPLWIVEQWWPIELYGDTRETWESRRYKDVDDFELGHCPRLDMIGEFPSEGVYDWVFSVGKHVGNTEEGLAVFDYRPISDDIMEDVKRRLREREKAPIVADAAQIEQELRDANVERWLKAREERRYWQKDVFDSAYRRCEGSRIATGDL
jgi:hypothetical protein